MDVALGDRVPLVLVQSVQAAALKTLFECLKDVLHDLSLSFLPEGIRVLAMDSSRTSLVHLRLDADKFDKYELKTGPVTAGVSAALLFKLLKVAGTTDIVTLVMYDTDIITLVVSNDNGRRTTYEIKALDVDTETIYIPDAVFDAVIKIPSNSFQKLIRDMMNVGTCIGVEKNSDALILSCTGDFVAQRTEIEYVSDPSDATTGNVVKGHFSLKHLALFAKCSSLCATTTLYMRNDFPLVVEYLVANLGTLKFVLAQIAI